MSIGDFCRNGLNEQEVPDSCSSVRSVDHKFRRDDLCPSPYTIPMSVWMLTAAMLLVPMDRAQSDHLRAYGLTYWVVQQGLPASWILNYRGGSFLLADLPTVRQKCTLMGVTCIPVSDAEVARIRAEIPRENMEELKLEKAPKVAVYVPPYAEPWDDAVTLALDYAGIPYDRIYDRDILEGALDRYDWLHLHHVDFSGQFGKFGQYAGQRWYQERKRMEEALARQYGFRRVADLKLAVAKRIKAFVRRGGFLFAMCSAPITLDVALAAEGVDIVDAFYDGTPVDPDYASRLDYSKTLAFTNFQVFPAPFLYEHTDVDVTQEAIRRGEKAHFLLRSFSAKVDQVPAILTQDHTRAIREFLGQDTGFRRSKLKPGVVILADVPGTDEVKYLYGAYGEGFFSFLGGHDPEDFQHLVGDPPTDLSRHVHSPGYRLILNNILFPSARRKPLKT